MRDRIIKFIAAALLVILLITSAWWALGLILPLFGVQPLTFMQTTAFIVLIAIARFIIK